MTIIPPPPPPDLHVLAALRHARTPIIFLDFDGVTHPEPSNEAFTQLPLIEEVLRAYPLVPVVLSTSWREQLPMDVICANFSSDIESRIIGATPVMDWAKRNSHVVPISRNSRQFEVELWMYLYLTMDHPWIAIDDREHWFEAGCRNLLTTNRNTGFTSDDAKQLHKMIMERR